MQNNVDVDILLRKGTVGQPDSLLNPKRGHLNHDNLYKSLSQRRKKQLHYGNSIILQIYSQPLRLRCLEFGDECPIYASTQFTVTYEIQV